MANDKSQREGVMAQGRVPAKLYQAFNAVAAIGGLQKQAAIGAALYLFINAPEKARIAAIRKVEDARNGTSVG